MTDYKNTGNTEADTTSHNINELVHIVPDHLGPAYSTSPTASSKSGSTRTYTPPLMGTSARAAKRRIDSDSGPVRIEGTDTYNQQLQHHYQNVRQILEDQQQTQAGDADVPGESRQSFSAKRDFFEQRFKTPVPTYDSPPRQHTTQKLVTTNITTSTIGNTADRTSSSSNESPSVDRVLEQAVELQKINTNNSIKNESQQPFIIERTEQYQVFLDSSNHEVRRTPSITRTTIVSSTKTGYATDLDQAQAQAERLTDDHQAIQQLTRVLQGHNVTTTNEYNRTNPISSSGILQDRTNLPVASEFTVIDALLNNPLGSTDDKHNHLLNIRHHDIISNIRNPEYLHSIKGSQKTIKGTKLKQTSSSTSTDTVVHAANSPLISTNKKLPSQTIEPVTTVSSEQTPLIDPKEKKKQDKENKKTKSKQKSTKQDYQVIDAIISSPISVRLPDSYLEKYNVTAPLSQSSLLPSKTVVSTTTTTKSSKDNHIPESEKDETLFSLAKVVNELRLHHTAALSKPLNTTTPSEINKTTESNEPIIINKQSASVSNKVVQQQPLLQQPGSAVNEVVHQQYKSQQPGAPSNTTVHEQPLLQQPESAVNEVVHQQYISQQPGSGLNRIVHEQPLLQQPGSAVNEVVQQQYISQQPGSVLNRIVHEQPLLEQQRPVIYSNQFETRPQSESIKPRIVYRYMDEQGRVLKMSSTPPSQLREQPAAQQYVYRNAEPPHFYGRHIAVDDDRRHPLPQHEQRATWQGEPKLPTTVTREDFELRDKRIPQLSEQQSSTTHTIPVSSEREHSARSSQQQQRTYHYPNQQNVKLAWLPLSYPADQQYVPSGNVGYDTDSTISERSATYRPYDYGPADNHYRYSDRPLVHNDQYYNRSPATSYYPPPPTLPYGGRGISPEYGSSSRNYIEVYRGGDFRKTKPSEIYSLPYSEHIRTTPTQPTNNRHSRYDQYQSEKYGTMTNRNNLQNPSYSNSLPTSRYQQNIPPPAPPPSTVYASTYYTHRSPDQHRTVQSSPNREHSNYIRQSKSFDYRPLRTKLQREYKITPNLLVDEWDYPQTSDTMKYSTTTASTNNRSGVSSPDDVFIKQPNNRSSEERQINRHEIGETNSQKIENKPPPQLNEKTPKDSQPIYKAHALHNFYAQTSRELPFKKGDIFLVKRRINDDWLQGEHKGLTGIFPLNHVQLFPIESIEQETYSTDKEQQIEGEAIVKYDFIPQKTFELQLRKGEKVILLRRIDNNWYEGRLNHIEGIFPAAYVETLKEPPDHSSKKSSQSPPTNVNPMPKSVLKKSPGLQQTAIAKMNIAPDLSLSMRKCQVLYDYTPQNPDELEIHVGDIINIIEMCDDGWYCGMIEKTKHGNQMEFGTFPGNYVKLLPA